MELSKYSPLLFLIYIRFSHNIQSYLKATEAESFISADHFHFMQLQNLFKAKCPILKPIISKRFFPEVVFVCFVRMV